jgi:hypothetical protein
VRHVESPDCGLAQSCPRALSVTPCIAYATERPDGTGLYLRRHSEKNTKEHQQFLNEIPAATRRNYLRWFKMIPLWLDLDDLRVIHVLA